MEKILERYERYSYAERQHQQQLGASDHHPQSKEHISMEYHKLKAKLEVLQRSQRHYLGEDLDALSMRELQNLEHQMDTALKHIRTRKNQLMHESISELQKKERAMQDQNNMLKKKIKEKEKNLMVQQHEAHWEHHQNQHHGAPSTSYFHLPQQVPCVNARETYQGGVDEIINTNELDLTLEPVYTYHLGCFAA